MLLQLFGTVNQETNIICQYLVLASRLISLVRTHTSLQTYSISLIRSQYQPVDLYHWSGLSTRQWTYHWSGLSSIQYRPTYIICQDLVLASRFISLVRSQNQPVDLSLVRTLIVLSSIGLLISLVRTQNQPVDVYHWLDLEIACRLTCILMFRSQYQPVDIYIPIYHWSGLRSSQQTYQWSGLSTSLQPQM